MAAVPYDVVNRAEAAELARGNPHSFLHVGRSDIDLPEDVDPYDPRIYARAREALDRAAGRRDAGPRTRRRGLFLYRQVMDGRAQTGVVGCVHVDDYERDLIRKHEKTRQDKEDDRTRHVLTLNANAEPVFLTYRAGPEIDAQVERIVATRRRSTISPRPTACATRCGRCPIPPRWSAPSARCRTPTSPTDTTAPPAPGGRGRSCRAAEPRRTAGDEEYNWFLAVLFPPTSCGFFPTTGWCAT